MMRSDPLCVPEPDALWLSNKLTWFLREYFREHLENLPFFHKWFVTLPSKLQQRAGPGMSSASSSSSSSSASAASSTVIRIVVLFSGEMDLYQVMQSLRLPSSMQFDHMLQRFSLRILCSHSLEEILTSKRLDFGSQWACRAQLDARLNRQAWAQLLSQLVKKLKVDAEQDAEERAFLAAEKEKNLQTDLLNARQRRDPHLHHGPGKPQTHSTNSGSSSSASDQHDEAPQQDALHGVRYWLEKLVAILGHSQEVSATMSFVDVSDALLGNRWVASVLLPRLLRHLKHMITTPGGVASEWKSACESFRAEFGTTQYAQAGGGSGTARKTLSRTSSRSSEQTDLSSQDQSIRTAFPFATPVSSSESHKRPLPPSSSTLPSARPEVSEGSTGGGNSINAKASLGSAKMREIQREEAQENELLELYDMCAKHLLGVSVVHAEAGTSGLTCVFEGWNVFSLLPRVQAPSGKIKPIVRIKSSASAASTTGSAASVLGGRSRS